MKKEIIGEFLDYLKPLVFIFAIMMFLNNFVIVNARVPSGSMENTIMTGDRLVGNRLAYVFGEPQRGDIVIFRAPDKESELYVKRVIGLPGDTVNILDGKVYINGNKEPLDEPYLPEAMIGNYGPYEVPAKSYFVLGDNRNNSGDSRFWRNKYVRADKILSEASFRYFPFSEMGTIK